MQRILITITITLLVATPLIGLGQIHPVFPGFGLNQGFSPVENGLSPLKKSGNRNTQINMSIGTSFTSVSGYGSFFRTYLSPSLSYNLSPRMTLMGGAVIDNYFFYPGKNKESTTYYPDNMTTATLWISGRYRVTPKLSLTGTAYKQLMPALNPAYRSFRDNQDVHGVILDLEFSPNENIRINTSFEYHKGSPAVMNPFYHPGHPFFYE